MKGNRSSQAILCFVVLTWAAVAAGQGVATEIFQGGSCAVSTDVDRDTEGCAPGRVAANLCGPQTSIRLARMPGPEESLRLPEMAGALMNSGSVNASALVEQFKGFGFGIRIPAIDPGFVGEFENAHIATPEGNTRRGHPAYGCAPSGWVRIEGYTDELLHGEFRAELFERSVPDSGPNTGNPGECATRPFKSISGRFSCAFPEMHAPDVSVRPSERETLRTQWAMESRLPAAALKQLMPGMPSSGLPASAAQQPCDCSCENVMSIPETAPCRESCKDEFSACTSRLATQDEVDEIIDLMMQGQQLPSGMRKALEQQVRAMSPEQREQARKTYQAMLDSGQ